MKENKNYAKLLDDNKLEYAPHSFKDGTKTIVPQVINDQFFFSRGYYKVIDNKPYYDSST